MSINNSFPQKPETSSLQMIITMGTVGCIAGILIVVTYQWTFPRIQKQKREYLQKSIFEVLPGVKKIVAFEIKPNGKLLLVKNEGKGYFLYAGYDNAENLIGIAVATKGQGFQDVIHILYGYSLKKECVIGMKVLESKETPGLGDKIEKDADFQENFKALDVSLTKERSNLINPIELVKHGTKINPWEIDAITGATISSQAIVNILNKSANEIFPIVAKNIDNLKRNQ